MLRECNYQPRILCPSKLFPKGQTNALKDIFVQTKAEQVCQEHTCTKGHSKGSTSDIRKGITYVRSHIQEGKTPIGKYGSKSKTSTVQNNDNAWRASDKELKYITTAYRQGYSMNQVLYYSGGE